MSTAYVARHAAAELAKLAETIQKKVPDDEEWKGVRQFLKDTSDLLKKGNMKSGLRAFYRVLPYVQHALSNVDRYAKVVDTYELTETIHSHFLVEAAAREHIEKVLLETKNKMATLRENIESFGKDLDTLLEEVLNDGRQVGLWTSVQLAFRMNRIAALLSTCEDGLQRARGLIDQIDTHVAGKSLLATLLSYVAILGSVVFSASGNLPVGAACLATATASRKSAQSLGEYRAKLADIDRRHQDLQHELTEWRFRFRAEQRNFLLLIGVKYAGLFLVVVAVLFAVLGTAANFLFFAAVVLYLVVKSEETNQPRYYAALAMAVLAALVEWHRALGLSIFNTSAAAYFICRFLGFLEII